MGFRIQVERLVVHRKWDTIFSKVARKETHTQKVDRDISSGR